MIRFLQRSSLSLVALVGLVGLFARADEPSFPQSYSKLTADQRFLFVMRSPWPKMSRTTGAPEVDPGLEIRDTYPKSGLFRNDGSKEPIWEVEWYSRDVEVSNDGVHLIRGNLWAGQLDEAAFSLLANGKLVRTYLIRDLVDAPEMLPRTIAHFRWCEGIEFDDRRATFRVWTLDRNQYTFDRQTGEMIERVPRSSIPVALTLAPADPFASIRLFSACLLLALLSAAGFAVGWRLTRSRRPAG
ncbi:MAG: hypothetical protein ACJ8F7_12670 [Gemmataceae bacterium]